MPLGRRPWSTSTRGIVGSLMPLLTDDYFITLPDPPAREVRDLNWLIATPDQLQANGLEQDIDHVERLLLLAQLCYAIGRLHKHGWVYGDLSYMNAAFALGPPRLMLLDCDGAARLTDLDRVRASRRMGGAGAVWHLRPRYCKTTRPMSSSLRSRRCGA